MMVNIGVGSIFTFIDLKILNEVVTVYNCHQPS